MRGGSLGLTTYFAEYAEPYSADRAQPVAEKSSAFAKFLSSGKYPLEQRIEDKKRGIGRQKYPFIGRRVSPLSHDDV